jgi:hypothetical protein
MKIDYVILADAAQGAGGKIYILGGGWSVFRAPAFPAPVQLGLGIGISHTSKEFGMTYPSSITIADDADVPVITPVSGPLQIQPAPTDIPQGVTQHRLPFAAQFGIALPRPGKYSITVRIGSSVVKTEFDALLVRVPQPGVPPTPEATPKEPRN